jgi:PPOX class probable F420-dependent enzyme
MERDEARRRFAAARVARLGTVTPQGRPHLVPVTFAVLDIPEPDGSIAFAVDAKPKTSRSLQRLRNLAEHPAATLLADVYDDDWSRLWWVRADGTARIVDHGPDFDRALDELSAKYPQYQAQRPAGPAVLVAVDRWRGWAAEEG